MPKSHSNLISVQPDVFFLVILMEKMGYRVYDLELRKVVVSHDVTFFENEFPFKNTSAAIDRLSLTHNESVFYDDPIISQSPIETPITTPPENDELETIFDNSHHIVPTSLTYTSARRQSTRPTNDYLFFRIIMWKHPSRLGLVPHPPLVWSPLQVCHTISLKSFRMIDYPPLIKLSPLL
ncbi:hypothetical protein ACOSQ4_003368 [Xanthoceras sorbifolium]